MKTTSTGTKKKGEKVAATTAVRGSKAATTKTTRGKAAATNGIKVEADKENLLKKLPPHLVVDILNKNCIGSKPRTLTNSSGLPQSCKYFRDIFSDPGYQGAVQPLWKKFQDYMKNFWTKSHVTIKQAVKNGIAEYSEMVEDGFALDNDGLATEPLIELMSIVILHGGPGKGDKVLIYKHDIKAPDDIEDYANNTQNCKTLTDGMAAITRDLTKNLEKHNPNEMSLYLFAYVSYLTDAGTGLVVNDALDEDDIPYFQALRLQLLNKIVDEQGVSRKGFESFRSDAVSLSSVFNNRSVPAPQDNITWFVNLLLKMCNRDYKNKKVLKLIKKENRIELVSPSLDFYKVVQHFKKSK